MFLRRKLVYCLVIFLRGKIMNLIIKVRTNIGAFIKKVLPKNFVFTILRGNLRGKKWYVSSSNPGLIFGIHEEKELIGQLENKLTSNSIFYDVGANVGYFTLLASEKLTNGKVIAFEPFQDNLFYLHEHLSINDIKNVEVHDVALSDSNGTTNFYIYNEGHGNITGDIYKFKENPLKVPKTSIDEIVYTKEIPAPDFVKIDVDGGEYLVLKGAKKTIREHKPTLFIETHTKELFEDCCELLQQHGYSLAILNINGKNKKQIHAY